MPQYKCQARPSIDDIRRHTLITILWATELHQHTWLPTEWWAQWAIHPLSLSLLKCIEIYRQRFCLDMFLLLGMPSCRRFNKIDDVSDPRLDYIIFFSPIISQWMQQWIAFGLKTTTINSSTCVDTFPCIAPSPPPPLQVGLWTIKDWFHKRGLCNIFIIFYIGPKHQCHPDQPPEPHVYIWSPTRRTTTTINWASG